MSSTGRLTFRHYQRKDDHPDWDALQEQAMAQAEAVLPCIHTDAEDGLAHKAANARRKARSLRTFAGNYRVNRRRWKAGNHALRPFYFIWTMLYGCNLRCTYCDDHRGNHYYDLEDTRLDFDDRLRVLTMMREATSAIMFCGGEPTIDPDFPKFTDAAWRLGYHPLMMNTNGFVLHKALQRPEWRHWLSQIDTIVYSLDGLCVPRLRGLWGIQKVEQVMVNLLMLRELRRSVDFKLVVNTVIGPDSIEMASDVLDFVNDLGDVWFVPVPLHCHGHEAEGFSFGRDLVERRDYQELAGRMLERKKQGHLMVGTHRLLDMLVHVKPYTCLPTLRPHVDPDGQVAWPCRGPKHCDPVYVNLLDYASVDECWEAANRLKSATHFHGPRPEQCGDRCAWMQNYTTARYHEFLTDVMHAGLLQEIKEFAFQTS